MQTISSSLTVPLTVSMRLVDQRRAVVERDDPHPLGQSGLEGRDLLLDPAGDFQRVLAIAHQHHAADNLLAVLLQHAAAEGRADLDRAQHADEDRRAVAALGDDRIADVIDVLDPTDRANQVLSVPLVDHPAADRRVGPGDSRVHLAQADAVGPELVGVEVDLVLLRRAPDAGHLGHARHAVELIADEPVLDRSQLAVILAATLNGVPKDLTDGRGVRGEIGCHCPAAETSRRSRVSRGRAGGRSNSRCRR